VLAAGHPWSCPGATWKWWLNQEVGIKWDKFTSIHWKYDEIRHDKTILGQLPQNRHSHHSSDIATSQVIVHPRWVWLGKLRRDIPAIQAERTTKMPRKHILSFWGVVPKIVISLKQRGDTCLVIKRNHRMLETTTLEGKNVWMSRNG
jgi:hypothetical protein